MPTICLYDNILSIKMLKSSCAIISRDRVTKNVEKRHFLSTTRTFAMLIEKTRINLLTVCKELCITENMRI